MENLTFSISDMKILTQLINCTFQNIKLKISHFPKMAESARNLAYFMMDFFKKFPK